ncbi:MAG: acyl-CoA dehydrogenase [Planctomycetes bacterium]|nr:acyl-CoA dehydrogenase [Planctomycetota bacterium]
MGNFYSDNEDIRFLFKHIELGKLASVIEKDYKFAKEFDHAPASDEEAIENYGMVLDSLGEMSANFISPRAESVDRQGNTLNEDGSVTYSDGIAGALDQLAKAEVCGCILPHRFGGLNFPNLVYIMATEIVSRADASLMNIFGLQGIGQTINSFANEEIKQQYLHDFSSGVVTGAMVLTEPDAGSDLQAIKLRAFQDDSGNWLLHGVKRFITNGCGEVLLVLARSEPDRSGGLGLSLFVCDRGPTVHIRRLEDKLGIHGSPTCEIFFDNTPCQLIGERQRGLVTYVMALMNGARIGIAAQSLGIAEATYRIARDYAASRKQYGVVIESFPAVREMVIDMKIAIEASRALLYETSRMVDVEVGLAKRFNEDAPADKDEKKALKNESRKYKRLAGMLTPMSKYYCSEMCNTVSYDSIQVLGGSGFMRDYACERHARDARITTIYEGTSQLQVVAAVRGVCSGTAERYIDLLLSEKLDGGLSDLVALINEGKELMKKSIVYVKENGNNYMDLYGRALVDIAIDLIIGCLFCSQASSSVEMEVAIDSVGGDNGNEMVSMPERKATIARRFITKNAIKIKSLSELICSGDKSTFSEYGAIVGPVPTE